LKRALLVLFALAFAWASPVAAHEVRPAYLELTEAADGAVAVTWKQPVVGELAVPLVPHLSAGWLDRPPARQALTDAFLTQAWRIAPPHAPLAGQTVEVQGLERTITDVLVRIARTDGTVTTQMLRPGAPSLVIPETAKPGAPVLDYLRLGVAHIWLGFDHLLYVFGLVLLAPQLRRLLATVTAFTVAHSLTLAASVFQLVTVSPPAVEAVIALSIVYVAVELAQARRGRPGLASRRPWAVAFGFGLLHGLGFASALREVGLPAGEVPVALLLFNAGIEMGQLAFVAAVLVALRALARAPRVNAGALRGAPYLVGGIGAFWMFERIAVLATG
jgi:hydrogenase/urease accessory protein HupE